MKLLINASNLYVGGGVQVAISLLEELTLASISYLAVVSPVVYKQLSKKTLLNCIKIESSPSKIFNVRGRKQLDNIVKQYEITTVFTVFGPSYWTPKNVKHAVGFALPWMIYDVKYIYSKLSLKAKIKFQILKIIQPFFYKKNADLIFTETDDVNYRVRNLLKYDENKVFTVSNTLNGLFTDSKLFDFSVLNKLPEKRDGEIWLLTISHHYPHKNLEVIGELVKTLPSKYKFIITVSSSFLNNIPEAYRNNVIAIGNVSVHQCAPLYERCDALFMPTLLECFSASYLEAMYMEKVIFTSDMPFAHTVCGDAAFYFDPYRIESIEKTIVNGFADKKMLAQKVENGAMLFKKFPSANTRALKYIEIIKSKLQ